MWTSDPLGHSWELLTTQASWPGDMMRVLESTWLCETMCHLSPAKKLTCPACVTCMPGILVCGVNSCKRGLRGDFSVYPCGGLTFLSAGTWPSLLNSSAVNTPCERLNSSIARGGWETVVSPLYQWPWHLASLSFTLVLIECKRYMCFFLFSLHNYLLG